MLIGVPRALGFYYLFPLYRTFLDELKIDYIETNATTLTDLHNLKLCPTDEPCISTKTAFSHAAALLNKGVDALFVPTVISLESKNYCCPKLMGLPSMLKAGFSLTDSELISPVINVKDARTTWPLTWIKAAEEMGVKDVRRSGRALQQAVKAWKQAEEYMSKFKVPLNYLLNDKKFTMEKNSTAIRDKFSMTAVMGHAYLLNDCFGDPIIKYISSNGPIVLSEMIPKHKSRKYLATIFEGEMMWSNEGHILGSCLYLIRNRKVGRVILVTAFSCGPLSIIENYVISEADKYGIPLLYLSIDEHTGEAGLLTRLEAFMDSCKARQTSKADIKNKICRSSEVALPSACISSSEPVVGIVTMGHLDISLSTLMNKLGVDVEIAGPLSDDMVNAGKELAPEFICYPMVTLLGQMRSLIEKGASKIIMVQGKGKCRLGWYAQIMEQILRKANYSVEVIAFDSPFPLYSHAKKFIDRWKPILGTPKITAIIEAVMVALQKQVLLDKSLDILREIRATEKIRGMGDQIHREFLNQLRETLHLTDSKKVFERYKRDMEQIPNTSQRALKIAIVGEIYVVNEPAVTKHTEKILGSLEQRVRVYRELSATSWLNCRIFKTPKALRQYNKVIKAARKYLSVDVGGHGQESVGEVVLAKASGMDGVLHLFPFTCMPEIIAQSILIKVASDLDLPVLSLMISEQTGVAGIQTRLEAFCDLLEGRKKKIAEVL